MFKNKKGDMTINIIIAAAIAMVVLVVMILIFTGGIRPLSSKSCVTEGGRIADPNQCGYDPASGNYVFDPTCVLPGNFNDVPAGKVCCAARDDGTCG